MNTKGQGALEYLLIIGGAVIVAGIVLTMLITTAPTVQGGTNQALADAMCAKFVDGTTQCGILDPDGDGPCAIASCTWTTNNKCIGASTRPTDCFGGSGA